MYALIWELEICFNKFQVLHSQILEWEKTKTLINEKGKLSKTLQLLDFGLEKTNNVDQKHSILDLQSSN